jgi:hypothetical protein
VLESAIEQLFFRLVREAGGLAIKLAPTHAGVPDRLVLWPDGRSCLVELKQTHGTVSKVQKLWHRKAEGMGHPVTVLYGAEQVRAWVELVQ